MNIEERLQDLPACPGVYLMKNSEGEIIYIGKAKALSRRVRSYFDGREKNGHRAAMFMVPHIKDIEWIITESELDALILEATLIQKHHPMYNVRQKDDKHYPYLMINLKEKFPRLLITRRVSKDGNLYFGPFLNSRYMRVLLDLIPRLFHLRECKINIPPKKPVTPCFNYHIKRCNAPCAGRITEGEYAEYVQEARALLEGKKEELLDEWRVEMQRASDEQRYEEAGVLRDKIQAVKSSFVKHAVDSGGLGLCADVVSVCRIMELACVVIFEYRDGVLSDRRHFNLESSLEKDESEILAEFLPRIYLNDNPKSLPKEIALEFSLGEDMELFEQLLTMHSGRKVCCSVVSERSGKFGYLRVAKANAEMLLMEMQAKKAKYNEFNRSIFDLQKELKLVSPPFCFECFDISHFGGAQPVASMVRFKNGHPSKGEYRRYMVKTAEGGDDFGSLREVLMRRLTRLLSENEKLPDLFVMDGGKGQVEAAFSVLKELSLEHIPVIGLAKRLEEIVFPGSRPSVLLRRNNPALQLLQRARDEAHRFAITYQRKKRSIKTQSR